MIKYYTILIHRFSNFSKSMELFFANDLKFFDFSDVNDEHYLSADNFLSLHYTQPNILSKCKAPKECLPSKLCDKVFLLSSEISTVKHLMCTLKKDQQGSFMLLQHIVQVIIFCFMDVLLILLCVSLKRLITNLHKEFFPNPILNLHQAYFHHLQCFYSLGSYFLSARILNGFCYDLRKMYCVID